MKKMILILMALFLVISPEIIAQCIADAGPDRVVCIGNNGLEPLQIGGNPTAVSGTPPFTYTWEGRYVITIGTLTFITTASEILNDTTLANPTVVNNDLLYNFRLILTITDADNNVSKDTMEVYYSIFGITMDINMYTINQGDSIFLDRGSNVFGGKPPYQYLWQPNHGLTDSTHLYFWAKPEHLVRYYVTVTDTAGCTFTGPDFYLISVYPVSVDETVTKNDLLSVFPNPTSEKISFQWTQVPQDELKLSIYNTSGTLVLSQLVLESLFNVDVSSFISGIYSYHITGDHGIVAQGSFVVK